MATRSMRIGKIEEALGEPWAAIRARLEAAGGAGASHAELAAALAPQFDGAVENHGWWVQGAVIAYEQEIGRRLPGQKSDGTFAVSVTRTLAGDRDEIIERLAAHVAEHGIDGAPLPGAPRRSRTDRRSFWRADGPGGIRLEGAAEQAAEGRTRLSLAVTQLADPEELERWRGLGKELLAQL